MLTLNLLPASTSNILKLETERILSYLNNEVNEVNNTNLREIEKLKHELYHDELTSTFNKKYGVL